MADDRWIYGFHAVVSRVRQHSATVKEVWVDHNRGDHRAQDLIRLAGQRQIRVTPVDSHRLHAMVGHSSHQGVVARVAPLRQCRDLSDVLENLVESPLLLVLDGIQDPHNLGACLRVADAMGVHAVIGPKDRAVGLTPAVEKVASGAVEVPYLAVTNLARTLRELKDYGVWIYGADSAATRDLFGVELRPPLAWVLGAEGAGLRRLTRENCDWLVRIPMQGTVQSLNVSVAAGMCLFETRRQMQASPGK